MPGSPSLRGELLRWGCVGELEEDLLCEDVVEAPIQFGSTGCFEDGPPGVLDRVEPGGLHVEGNEIQAGLVFVRQGGQGCRHARGIAALGVLTIGKEDQVLLRESAPVEV